MAAPAVLTVKGLLPKALSTSLISVDVNQNCLFTICKCKCAFVRPCWFLPDSSHSMMHTKAPHHQLYNIITLLLISINSKHCYDSCCNTEFLDRVYLAWSHNTLLPNICNFTSRIAEFEWWIDDILLVLVLCWFLFLEWCIQRLFNSYCGKLPVW